MNVCDVGVHSGFIRKGSGWAVLEARQRDRGDVVCIRFKLWSRDVDVSGLRDLDEQGHRVSKCTSHGRMRSWDETPAITGKLSHACFKGRCNQREMQRQLVAG
jgi:hypothetical protein